MANKPTKETDCNHKIPRVKIQLDPRIYPLEKLLDKI